MTEYERVKKEALLSDGEIDWAWPSGTTAKLPKSLADIPQFMAEIIRCAKAIAQAQFDKVLKTNGIRIETDSQSLPKNPIGDFIPDIGKGQQWAYQKAQQDMLKPDSEGRVWVRVVPKRK